MADLEDGVQVNDSTKKEHLPDDNGHCMDTSDLLGVSDKFRSREIDNIPPSETSHNNGGDAHGVHGVLPITTMDDTSSSKLVSPLAPTNKKCKQILASSSKASSEIDSSKLVHSSSAVVKKG